MSDERCPRCGGPTEREQIAVPASPSDPKPWPTVPGGLRCVRRCEDGSDTPEYLRIAYHYQARIVGGRLRPGDKLPSERAIADRFGVARPTATKALDVLRREGLVESLTGAGTFVAEPGTWAATKAWGGPSRRELVAIVRDLAACPEPWDGDNTHCPLCLAHVPYTGSPGAPIHEPGCPWRRAREWTETHP